jgi:hypothetical protein
MHDKLEAGDETRRHEENAHQSEGVGTVTAHEEERQKEKDDPPVPHEGERRREPRERAAPRRIDESKEALVQNALDPFSRDAETPRHS